MGRGAWYFFPQYQVLFNIYVLVYMCEFVTEENVPERARVSFRRVCVWVISM